MAAWSHSSSMHGAMAMRALAGSFNREFAGAEVWRESLAAAVAMASNQHGLASLSSAKPQSSAGATTTAQQSFQQGKHQMQGQGQMNSHMQHQQLQMFWQQQNQEMEQLNEKSSKSELLMTHLTEFKNHQLPLARIKKIMKSDEDVKMIAAEAPVLFAKACEMFILELTLRSWIHTEENKRRTLQRNDIAGAITRGDIFDFLVDIVPRDELKEEETAVPWSGGGGEQVQYGGMFYPSMPPQSVHYPMGAPDVMVVQSTMPSNQPSLYAANQQGDMQ
nr:nuclear transcription factor Y subunit C-2-like [Physcomitrium patens]|eukprot:XP_024384329.1 nuclear transcription factor Y subunit C-2-like [Physcomitrella patens]